MSAVTGSSFSWRQNVSPSMPGMPTSRTTTSGARARDLLLRVLGGVGLLDLDVDDLEGRAQEDAQRGVVVDDEQPQPALVDAGEAGPRASIGSRRDGASVSSGLKTWTRFLPANFAA